MVAYELYQANDETPAKQLPHAERRANKQELVHLFNRIENELDERGYFDNIQHRRSVILRNMRNMFARFAMLDTDIRAMQGIIKGLTINKKEK
ncbi:hypothetical protein [Sneathiella glossodoripedis]|uniref:hypothetical protein n=1 Tax=Sneathiella glossodoripedis TaxID=418853 RepID=UPI001901A24A|nr:hypothetical protein [Sneathiella glossodoripedis]